MQDDEVKLRIGQKRNKKDIQRRRKHKAKLRSYHSRSNEFYRKYVRPKQEYANINAPATFSVSTNRSETISYIKKINKNITNRVFTCMDLSDVENTDLPTICLLTGYMLDYRTNAKYLEVKIPPKSSPYRKIWDDVQFDSMVVRKRRSNFKTGRFLSRSTNSVNLISIGQILDEAIKFFGESNRSQINNLAPVIVEIVENTGLHANPAKKNKLPWILNTRTIQKDEILEMEFCIVDLGVGVYDSIKENVQRWNTARSKLLHRLTNAIDSSSTQCKFFAENIPKGIGSSTNEVKRGKGIRYIHQISQDPIYTLFDIITNKAHVELKDLSNIKKDSSENLFATVYHWKIQIHEE